MVNEAVAWALSVAEDAVHAPVVVAMTVPPFRSTISTSPVTPKSLMVLAPLAKVIVSIPSPPVMIFLTVLAPVIALAPLPPVRVTISLTSKATPVAVAPAESV